MPRALSPEDMWDIQVAAAYLRLKKRTLYYWKYQGKGPEPHKMHGNLYYVPAEVKQWAKIELGI